jgi:NADH-dependent fumarate reductase subunit C
VNLRPTSVPLTVKEYDREACGLCAGCGCSCGYIAYLKGKDFADLYGHPADPNGMGSLCTKGITYIQQIPSNPLRIKEPLLREGQTFRVITFDRAVEIIKERWKGKKAFFLDRHTDLYDAVASLSSGEVFSDSLFLPFAPSSLKPQDWASKRFILLLECETVFSEVMATRWLVDAFESSARIVSVSSRYATSSAKATDRLTVTPAGIVHFILELESFLEGKKPVRFADLVEKTARALSLVRESLILVGEQLLRYPWKYTVLSALSTIIKKTGADYSVVGDVSPLKTGDVEEFLKRAGEFELVFMTGNPLRWAREPEKIFSPNALKVYLGYFPNITALNSDLILPMKTFAERDFFIYRNGFGIRELSPKILEPPPSAVSLRELLEKLGAEEVKPSLPDLPSIADAELPGREDPPEDDPVWLIASRGLVEELGHWNPWTHAIEREQRALINPRTADELSLGDVLGLGEVEIPLERNSNVAERVILIPESFEEYQPFDPGVRPGLVFDGGKIIRVLEERR